MDTHAQLLHQDMIAEGFIAMVKDDSTSSDTAVAPYHGNSGLDGQHCAAAGPCLVGTLHVQPPMHRQPQQNTPRLTWDDSGAWKGNTSGGSDTSPADPQRPSQPTGGSTPPSRLYLVVGVLLVAIIVVLLVTVVSLRRRLLGGADAKVGEESSMTRHSQRKTSASTANSNGDDDDDDMPPPLVASSDEEESGGEDENDDDDDDGSSNTKAGLAGAAGGGLRQRGGKGRRGKRGKRRIGKLAIHDAVLGRGSFGTVVFKVGIEARGGGGSFQIANSAGVFSSSSKGRVRGPQGCGEAHAGRLL